MALDFSGLTGVPLRQEGVSMQLPMDALETGIQNSDDYRIRRLAMNMDPEAYERFSQQEYTDKIAGLNAAIQARDAMDQAWLKEIGSANGQQWVDDQRSRGTLPMPSMRQGASSFVPDATANGRWNGAPQTAPGRWVLPEEQSIIDRQDALVRMAETTQPIFTPQMQGTGINTTPIRTTELPTSLRLPDIWDTGIPSNVSWGEPKASQAPAFNSPQKPAAKASPITPYLPIAPGQPQWNGPIKDPFPFDKPRSLAIAPGQPVWKNRVRTGDKYRSE